MCSSLSCFLGTWKALKTRGICMVDVSKVTQQGSARRASQSNRQRLRSNATKETEDTSRIRMDVITPPPIPPPPPPHRAERQMQVEAGVCKKSRVCKHTVKIDAKCDTHRKQQKNHKTKVAFAGTSSPPPPSPPPPPRSWRVQKVESRRKHRKNRCKMLRAEDEVIHFQEGHDIACQEVHFRDLARTGWPCPKTSARSGVRGPTALSGSH